MNERIENLCLAAGLYAKLPNGNNYPVSMSAEEQRESLNKFAELIVKDCLDVCRKQFVGAVGSHASAHNRAIMYCRNSIKEIFEIEDSADE